jgi:hypothetical protein
MLSAPQRGAWLSVVAAAIAAPAAHAVQSPARVSPQRFDAPFGWKEAAAIGAWIFAGSICGAPYNRK